MLFASLCLLATSPAPFAGVGRITLEDLWRGSETVVLGRVESVVDIARDVPPGGPEYTNEKWWYAPSFPIAVIAVQRVLRGSDDLKSVLVFAKSTWVCDITTAKAGETALFFLDPSELVEQEGQTFRTAFASLAGERKLMEIQHAGRGRMPVRRSGEEDVVDIWTEVRIPEGVSLLDGPDPDRSYITSAILSEIAGVLEGFESLEERPLLAGSALAAGGTGSSWELLVAEDGWSKLTIHGKDPFPDPKLEPIRGQNPFPDPRRDRLRVFRLSDDRMTALFETLRSEWTADLPGFVGSASEFAWQREIRSFRHTRAEDGSVLRQETSMKLGPVQDAHVADVDARRRTRSALRIWRELRGTFEVPGCVDLRPDDARWIE